MAINGTLTGSSAGGEFQRHTASFSKLLKVVCAESTVYRELVLRTFMNDPPTADSPWDLVMHAGEVSPGIILKVENKRKMWAFYIAVKQLGPLALQRESCWLPVAVMRTTELKKIKVGVDVALVALLNRLFHFG